MSRHCELKVRLKILFENIQPDPFRTIRRALLLDHARRTRQLNTNVKKTGAGLLKSLNFPAFLPMAPLLTKPWQEQRYSLYAFWLSDLRTMRQGRNPSLSGSRLHDLLAIVQGQTGTLRALPNWLDAQATIRFPQDALPPWVARCGLRVSRRRGNRSAHACPCREAHRFDT